MLFLLSLELSGLKLNLVLYLIFRLLVGVFSFIRFWFAFSFFCCFISQTITDRWHFSASEIMSDFKVFFSASVYTLQYYSSVCPLTEIPLAEGKLVEKNSSFRVYHWLLMGRKKRCLVFSDWIIGLFMVFFEHNKLMNHAMVCLLRIFKRFSLAPVCVFCR